MLRRQLIDEVQSMANQGRASVDIAVRLDMTIEAVDEALGPADGCGFSPFVARKAKKIQDGWTDKQRLARARHRSSGVEIPRIFQFSQCIIDTREFIDDGAPPLLGDEIPLDVPWPDKKR